MPTPPVAAAAALAAPTAPAAPAAHEPPNAAPKPAAPVAPTEPTESTTAPTPRAAPARPFAPAAHAQQLAYAVDLLTDSAVALRLPQPVAAHAALLLHRFFLRTTPHHHSPPFVAATSLLVASKLHDAPRALRHVANVLYDRLAATNPPYPPAPRPPLDFYGAVGYDWKQSLISAERHLLRELGFRVAAELPHKFVLIFVNTLRDKADAPAWTAPAVAPFRALLQAAWNFANDALRLSVCVREQPADIAVACIALAARHCGMQLPVRWQMVFGCSMEVCERVAADVRAAAEIGDTKGVFVDYARCALFSDFHPGGVGKRKGEGERDPVPAKRRRSRFEDRVP